MNVADEKIIAALMEHGTIEKAAKAAGLSERAIYDRMKTHEFQAKYQSARTDILRNACVNVSQRINGALDVITEIMQDQETAPTARLQAASIVLKTASDFTERLRIAERETVQSIRECERADATSAAGERILREYDEALEKM